MSETSPTPQELLDAVNRGIIAVADGVQSYSLPDGRQVTRANLREMRELRDALTNEIAASADGGGFYTRLGFRGAS